MIRMTVVVVVVVMVATALPVPNLGLVIVLLLGITVGHQSMAAAFVHMMPVANLTVRVEPAVDLVALAKLD